MTISGIAAFVTVGFLVIVFVVAIYLFFFYKSAYLEDIELPPEDPNP